MTDFERKVDELAKFHTANGTLPLVSKRLEAYTRSIHQIVGEECAKVAEQYEPDEKLSDVMYASRAIRELTKGE